MTTQANFGRVLINGWELTADSLNTTYEHAYHAHKTMPQNVGVTQYTPGAFEPALSYNGYKRTGQGAITAHNLLSPAGVGAASDTEFVITQVLGNNAAPTAGDTAILFDGTLLDYTRQQKFDDVQTFSAKFAPRGKRMPLGTLILDSNAKSTGISSPITDDGLGAGSTALGGVAVMQVYNPTGAAASGSIGLTANPSDGDNFTIGIGATNYVYTFKTAIAAVGHVLIGASAAATIANLFAALTGGLGAGVTYYAGTTPLPAATLIAGVPGVTTTITLTAVQTGTAANAYTLAKSGANLTVSGATLSGGINGDTIVSAQLQSATSSGGSYSPFVTFSSTGQARTAERIEVPVGTAINGFLKATVTVSGTNYPLGLMIAFGRFWQL
ncbi:MAG TPA: hypothetical protein VMT34_11805 [Aggregatilineales bacterium]|nr:hypothetical protein [Aggregatilineales bacterium]